jgi:hypothetical protein
MLCEGARAVSVIRAKKIVEQSTLFDVGEAGSEEASRSVSARRDKKIGALASVRDRREADDQDLGYGSRPFLLCNLPVKRPPREQLIWQRRNGAFFLRIEGSPSHGLPYGSDRLVPILVATLAVLQQSREVRLGSVASICRLLGLEHGGYSYKRIMEAFERIFSATIYFGTERDLHNGRLVDKSRMAFFDRMRLWYQEPNAKGNRYDAFDNVIYLSEAFWDELKHHPIPVDLSVVRALRDSPGCLDFCLWLTMRSYTVRDGASVKVPLFGPNGLIQQLGMTEYSHKPRIRQKLREWLDIFRVCWPACPAQLEGDYLNIQHGSAINRRAVPSSTLSDEN